MIILGIDPGLATMGYGVISAVHGNFSVVDYGVVTTPKDMEIFKQFQDNPSFKKWLSDLVFNITYNKEGKSYQLPAKKPAAITYAPPPPSNVMMVAEHTAPYGEKKSE